MKPILLAISTVFVVSMCAIAAPSDAAASLRITNAHLVATCVDGSPVAPARRRWEVTAPVSITFTMRNEPRPGIEHARPGAGGDHVHAGGWPSLRSRGANGSDGEFNAGLAAR